MQISSDLYIIKSYVKIHNEGIPYSSQCFVSFQPNLPVESLVGHFHLQTSAGSIKTGTLKSDQKRIDTS